MSCTVWKFQDFSVTQILREINFGQCKSSKTAVFAFFGTLNFVTLENFSLLKVQKFIKIKICKNDRFCTSRILNFDFTQNHEISTLCNYFTYFIDKLGLSYEFQNSKVAFLNRKWTFWLVTFGNTVLEHGNVCIEKFCPLSSFLIANSSKWWQFKCQLCIEQR